MARRENAVCRRAVESEGEREEGTEGGVLAAAC
jgi:hypothetical protein